MSSDVSLTGGGSSITSPDTVTSASSTSSSTGTGTTVDSVSQSESIAESNAILAHSPQLVKSTFILWSMGGSNLTVQNASTGTPAEVDTHLFLLQTQLKYEEIVTKVLNAWTESVHKQAEEMKREMKSEAYRQWEKVHGHQGYEAWLNTLSPEQRLQTLTYPHLDKKVGALEGIADSLSDYLVKTKISGDIQLSQDVPFITAALVTTGVFASIPDTVSTSQILVQPLKDASDRSLVLYTPNHAAELGYLGGIFMAGSSYFALGQTVAKAGAPKEEINYEFAKNYGEKVLSLVNGSQFNSIAMALLTHQSEGAAHLGEDRIKELVMSVKVTLLSTALALLYATESSFKGKGGGITGKEFGDLVNGKAVADSDLKRDLVGAIADARDQMNDNGTGLISGLAAYFDSTKKWSDFVDVGGILNNLVYDQSAGTAVAV